MARFIVEHKRVYCNVEAKLALIIFQVLEVVNSEHKSGMQFAAHFFTSGTEQRAFHSFHAVSKDYKKIYRWHLKKC